MKAFASKLILVFLFSIFLLSLLACSTAPGLTVSGQLLDTDGEPVDSVQIMLGSYRNFLDQYHAFSIPSVGGLPFGSPTDRDGKFLIAAADPGSYLLLYEETAADGGTVLHALTDKQGHVLMVEISEAKGVDVKTIQIATYPGLPNKYLPEFLSAYSLGMSMADFDKENPGFGQPLVSDEYISYEKTDIESDIAKIVFAFGKENSQLEQIEIWYAEETGAYQYPEQAFGIPHTQAISSDGESTLNWIFNFGNSQVIASAQGQILTFRVQD